MMDEADLPPHVGNPDHPDYEPWIRRMEFAVTMRVTWSEEIHTRSGVTDTLEEVAERGALETATDVLVYRDSPQGEPWDGKGEVLDIEWRVTE